MPSRRATCAICGESAPISDARYRLELKEQISEGSSVDKQTKTRGVYSCVMCERCGKRFAPLLKSLVESENLRKNFGIRGQQA